MTAADIYLSALRGWKAAEPKQERSPVKEPEPRQKPTILDGGCLLYRLPQRKREVN